MGLNTAGNEAAWFLQLLIAHKVISSCVLPMGRGLCGAARNIWWKFNNLCDVNIDSRTLEFNYKSIVLWRIHLIYIHKYILILEQLLGLRWCNHAISLFLDIATITVVTDESWNEVPILTNWSFNHNCPSNWEILKWSVLHWHLTFSSIFNIHFSSN